MGDKIVWRNERRKLRELIPWPRNPRQINKQQAARLEQFCLYRHFSPFRSLVAGNTEGYQIGKRVRSLVIPFEDVRGNDVVNVKGARPLVFLVAKLTSPVIPLDSLSSLATPIFSIGDASAVTMNKSRVSITLHEFGTALVGATNILRVFQSGLRNSKFFMTVSAVYRSCAAKFGAASIRLMDIKTLSPTKFGIFRSCGCKRFVAYRTHFLNAGNSLDLITCIPSVTGAATKDIFRLIQAVCANGERFSAVGTNNSNLILSHCFTKKVIPSGWRCCCRGNTQLALGDHEQKKNRLWVMLPRQLQFSTIGNALQ